MSATPTASPLVSVVVDTHDHEAFVGDALDSVFAQGLRAPELEVIVVDDGSTDATADVAERVPDVRVVRKANGGQASAFNVALPLVSGRYVAILDGDDWWSPEKLSSVLEAFELDRSLDAVGHGYVVSRGDGRPEREVSPKVPRIRLHDANDVSSFIDNKAFLGAGKMVVRREILQAALPVPEPLVVEADEWLFTLVAATTTATLLTAPLLYYRQHGGNLFMVDPKDRVRTRRKRAVLAHLAVTLPPALAARGLSPVMAADVVLPLRVESERLRLLEGGRRRETRRVERDAATLRARQGEPERPVTAALARGLAWILPPRWYYRVRESYGRLRSGA
jgi:glycosyltransferase involved in cell wall biosynthesis